MVFMQRRLKSIPAIQRVTEKPSTSALSAGPTPMRPVATEERQGEGMLTSRTITVDAVNKMSLRTPDASIYA